MEIRPTGTPPRKEAIFLRIRRCSRSPPAFRRGRIRSGRSRRKP
ncbi:unnamed protein product [Linum tenue]|uniref:Uncharacterized protein n=1 Tax=Linum tenue TaxID=586396 RepID=A0AAV0NQP8_9ROSI|nr:unnamed protein product [Linum tenue]